MSIQSSVVGNVYGELTVIEELEPHITPNGSRQRCVRCRCSCGNVIDVRLQTAKKKGKCRSCSDKERRIDITGKRFGKLVVTAMADDYYSPSGNRLSRCECLCDCGNTCIVNMSALITGATQSCGCLKNVRGLLKDDKEVMKKYDFEKNKGVDLDSLMTCSNEKVWWKCEVCGNSWLAVVSSQTDKKKQHGCPYCAGRLPIKGKTDLASQHSDLLIEWDYNKNDISPDDVSCFSTKKIWWKCAKCGHSWQQTVANRVNGSGCPKCNFENVNSFAEQAVYFYVKQAFPDAINSDNHIGMELDIYIPSKNIGIEYDGEAWHSSKKKTKVDERKNQLCKENRIELLRIREPKLDDIDSCIIFHRSDSTTDESLSDVIQDVLLYLEVDKIDVDVSRDNLKILAQYATKKYENSLEYCYPDIAKEWHPTKNEGLTPDKVSKATNKKVWWLGECGHEWQMRVQDRTCTRMKNEKILKPQGCPICYKEKKSPSVICVETGQVFSYGMDAARFIGAKSASSIYACCRGKYKTAGGYHWKYNDSTLINT